MCECTVISIKKHINTNICQAHEAKQLKRRVRKDTLCELEIPTTASQLLVHFQWWDYVRRKVWKGVDEKQGPMLSLDQKQTSSSAPSPTLEKVCNYISESDNPELCKETLLLFSGTAEEKPPGAWCSWAAQRGSLVPPAVYRPLPVPAGILSSRVVQTLYYF